MSALARDALASGRAGEASRESGRRVRVDSGGQADYLGDDLLIDHEAVKAAEYLQAGVEAELVRGQTYLGEEEVQAAQAMDDEEAERALANEIGSMKDRDPREWVRLLASMPQAERDEMRRIEKKYGL